jgi:DNA mismatch endonuclease (patch repair protein)
MTDVLTKRQRSYNMSMIRASRTAPELKLKPLFVALGFRYQPKLYGKPDFANFKAKIAVFVDGCFWHRCPKHYAAPKQNAKFWEDKIGNNIRRDKAVNFTLKKQGWNVVRIWEHSLKG